jgi:hypothetical protein
MSNVPPFIDTPARCGRIATDYHRAAANRRGHTTAGVAVDNQRPAHHRFGRTPARAAANFDMRAVHHAADVVADAAFEDDVDSLKQCDREIVPGVGIVDDYFALTGSNSLTYLTIDCPG